MGAGESSLVQRSDPLPLFHPRDNIHRPRRLTVHKLAGERWAFAAFPPTRVNYTIVWKHQSDTPQPSLVGDATLLFAEAPRDIQVPPRCHYPNCVYYAMVGRWIGTFPGCGNDLRAIR